MQFPLSSSFYKRPSQDSGLRTQDSPAQEAGKTSQQPSQPESPGRRASSSEPTLLECIENYEAQGYSRDIVMDALGRASRRPGPNAERLMELLRKNEGLKILGLRSFRCIRASRSVGSELETRRLLLRWLL
ncbi:hypothetical protein E4U13_005205 [Claviceps humidiphila]|uniref:Uncharacterized protein n=1 Tax=Claviceps humidiphila TaxID=1294629 RepID=A0A9P7Q0K7_9HYPO|nr:hypothetical protein E4U13_005205 [Claviceps humidiphila]